MDLTINLLPCEPHSQAGAIKNTRPELEINLFAIISPCFYSLRVHNGIRIFSRRRSGFGFTTQHVSIYFKDGEGTFYIDNKNHEAL